MDKKQLQDKILSQKYDRAVWMDTLKEIFAVKVLYQIPQPINLSSNDIASQAVELGKLHTADEREVGIYEVILKDEAKTKIPTNKVGLRNLLRSIYKYEVDAALIVFVHKDKWRFSYVSEIKTIDGKKETEPKRYTYVFGKGESCRTAADRFFSLKDKRYYLQDLFEAFSVEKLNKDFFKSYKGFFEKYSEYMADQPAYRKALLKSNKPIEGGWKSEEAKPIRDFVKKLLGRLVFLQFLQKKGWIGVPAKVRDWTGGDVKFLQNLFTAQTNNETFHSEVLTLLFFETLNTKRKNDLADPKLGKDIKIPYLNGGLFDRDISVQHKIDFPAHFFGDLLDFFEHYNFTIDENDPDESEVGIDPEMLGHIFENLLEENREKGAFYTPKEIVYYMCQESLIQYLTTELPDESKEDIEALVRYQRITGDFGKTKKANLINDKLKAVKICDPAIGSGAFPMGLLRMIFECRRLLYGYLKTNENFDPAAIKKEIIQNNIYGVDLENGAVEIARLRFWLALVVDELVPQPLPNLDYKIMQGNSLLESFHGTDLSNLADMDNEETFLSAGHGQLEIGAEFSKKKQTLLVFDLVSKEKLYELISAYYSYDESVNNKYGTKQDIKTAINEIVEGKLLAKFSLMKFKIESELEIKTNLLNENVPKPEDSKGVLAKKEKNKWKLMDDIKIWVDELNNIEHVISHLHELQDSIDKPYFLWHLWFKDVFNRGGFDIVIGNPPYIQLQKMGAAADLLKQGRYQTFTRSGDLYCIFFELGNKLLKKQGTLSYITSNSWLRANYGKNLRDFLIENTNPNILIDLSDSDVFQSATVRTSILIFKKASYKNNLQAIRITKKSQDKIKVLNSFFEQNSIWLKTDTEDAWAVTDIDKVKIKEEVQNRGKRLTEWNIQINRGIVTGLNEAFVIDEATKQNLISEDPNSEAIIKRLLRGRDLKKYGFNNENLFLIATFPVLKLNIDNYIAIKKHLLSFGKKKLEQSGESGSRKKTGNDWFETQDQINYWENFEKPKIIYPNMVTDISFTYDDKGYYTNQKCFIMTGEKLKYLVGVLNSKLFRYCFEEDFPEIQGNAREINKVVFEQIPIKYPNDLEEMVVTKLVEHILYLNDPDNRQLLTHTANVRIAATIEEVLNMVVYELYFADHMRENNLNVMDGLIDALTKLNTGGQEILDFYLWIQQPENIVRNRIIAVDIRSPEYLSRINTATR